VNRVSNNIVVSLYYYYRNALDDCVGNDDEWRVGGVVSVVDVVLGVVVARAPRWWVKDMSERVQIMLLSLL
jgi:hypothetical protein